MAGFIQNLLKDAVGGFFGSDYLRDFTHASKTFRTGSYQNAPKNKFLFHVYFDINPDVYNIGLAQGANYGLAVKTVKLPGYNFTTHEMNQYNRKRIVQTKIKYDPVDITFHDDAGTATGPLAGGMIRQLWEHYYRYHYNDSTKPQVQMGSGILNKSGGSTIGYNTRSQYTKEITGDENWGYVGETPVASGVKTPFFKTINIFGFNQHKYVAYVLVNPIITRFGHDTYSYAEGGGTMENSMTIDYETVVYDSGAIAGATPDQIALGFGSIANYDRTVSPIAVAGSQNTILGPGGLVNAGTGIVGALASGNILGAIKTAGTALTTAQSMNLGQVAAAELVAGLQNAVVQTPNRNPLFVFPTAGSTPMPAASAPVPLAAPPAV